MVEDPELNFVMLVVGVEEDDLGIVDAVFVEDKVTEVVEAETAVEENVPVNED